MESPPNSSTDRPLTQAELAAYWRGLWDDLQREKRRLGNLVLQLSALGAVTKIEWKEDPKDETRST